jgi:nitroreductase
MLELIRTRRSIRRFRPEPVGEDARRALEETALRAPTSRDLRPCEFVFVTEPETLRALAGLKPHGSAFLAGAPLAVVVLADPARSDVWIEDASIAAAFLHLAAHSLGLGSCWVQVRRRPHADGRPASEFVRDVAGAPEGLEALAVIGIGHPAETKEPVPDRDLPRAKIHAERFAAR